MKDKLNYKYSEEPFKHIIEDDFLTQEDFTNLKSLIPKLVNNSKCEYGNSVTFNQARIGLPNCKVIKGSSILNDVELINFYKRYEHKLFFHLDKLAPYKKNLCDSFSFQMSKTSKEGAYHIHDDSAEKLLSIVIYLSPEKSIGTMLFKGLSSKPSKVVEWRQNRYLAFSRLQGKTRHSYRGDNIEDRYTIILNLLTSKRNIAMWREPGFKGKIFVIRLMMKNFFLKVINLKNIKLIRK